MIEATCDYYARRAAEQTALGDRAAMPRVAVVHYELAYRYALLSSGFERAPGGVVGALSAAVG
jgi:hypothetical protein